MRNLHHRFDWHYIGQIYGGDFANFCGLLRIYELYSIRNAQKDPGSNREDFGNSNKNVLNTENIFDPIAKLVEKHCNVGIDPVTVFLTNGFEIFTPDFLSVILRCKHISLLAYHLLITKEILPLKSFKIFAGGKFVHFTM